MAEGLRNGALAASASSYAQEDPAWLALSKIYYALLPGNQQPSFRVAVGQADTRAWLAWEVRALCAYRLRFWSCPHAACNGTLWCRKSSPVCVQKPGVSRSTRAGLIVRGVGVPFECVTEVLSCVAAYR